MPLKVYQELTLRGPDEKLAALMTAVSKALPTGWSGPEKQKRDRYRYDVFHVTSEAASQAANLFLSVSAGELELVNIVPESTTSLSVDEYNAIVEAFASTVRGLAKTYSVEISELGPSAEITRWLSTRAADALRSFSGLANKSTGSAHPMDFARWARFMVYCQRDGCDIPADLLQQYLVREEGWDQERAYKLVLEYEFGLSLLKEEAKL